MPEVLDMKNTPCPINFVRTKIKLDEMEAGQELEVYLDDGEPIESVSTSVQEEGHKVVSKEQREDGSWSLLVLRQ